MSFKAEPDSIKSFGERLSELANESNKAAAYVEEWLKIDGEDSRMYFTAASAAENARNTLTDNYDKLKKIQNEAATEIDKAASLYQRLDQEEARKLDRSYE
ncbi:antirestriction protein ArdC [Actinopolyspora biskrensis]|uniref:Antirestriction protein ArdC n=1 Tax=Actinopolyspora biskrensis TaxID=1470178 RepID=A0A852Z5J5_9ACTN|nr:antirestriction protein ArdC [Actinopolyspora biskrensis]